MSGVARKLVIFVAVAAIAFAHTLAPHRVLATHGLAHAIESALAAQGAAVFENAPAIEQHASGTPCHGHDASDAPPDHAKAPHDCCAAACHFIAMIDGTTNLALAVLTADVPLSGAPALREATLRALDPPPRIG